MPGALRCVEASSARTRSRAPSRIAVLHASQVTPAATSVQPVSIDVALAANSAVDALLDAIRFSRWRCLPTRSERACDPFCSRGSTSSGGA